MGEGGFRTFSFLRLPPSAFPLCLYSCRQFAQREEAAGGGVHFIYAWPFEDDLGPGLVGDFHESRSHLIFAAQGDGGGRRILRIGPAAIGHAGDPADQFRLRRDDFFRALSGGCSGGC